MPAEARLLARPFLERTPRVPSAASSARRATRSSSSSSFATRRRARRPRVPGSVQSLVQARFDRLDPADKAALQAASVLGQQFDLETLRHILGQPDYSIEPLVERLLVRPEGEGFLFAHALIRDAVYDGLLRNRRRELHRRAADWYEGRDAAPRAEHLDRADDPDGTASLPRGGPRAVHRLSP